MLEWPNAINGKDNKNLEGYVISTSVISLDIDFKKISDGLTRAKSFNPNLQASINFNDRINY